MLLYIVNILKTVAVEVYFGIEQRICLNTLTELTVTLFAQRVFAFLKQLASQNWLKISRLTTAAAEFTI